MLITDIAPINKQKSKIFLDETFAFVLYSGEMKRYKIKLDAELSEDDYHKIRTEIITKRAKKRVLHLLEQVPRSESQLRTKLKQGHYPSDIIDTAIDYAKSFGYIDDTRYAQMYIQSKLNTRSKREIYAALLTKGVERDIAKESLENIYTDESEASAIEKYIRKKRYNLDNITPEELRRLNAYLARKGFSYDQIQNSLQHAVLQ